MHAFARREAVPKRLKSDAEPTPAVHVVPHYASWAVKREGGVRVSRLAENQEDAIGIGKRIAKRDKVELVVFDNGGLVQSRITYSGMKPEVESPREPAQE